ncbi:MAG: D-threonine aldolase [Nitrospira sp.]|nr:D-threonine aldolase [Nitrospira sp.]
MSPMNDEFLKSLSELPFNSLTKSFRFEHDRSLTIKEVVDLRLNIRKGDLDFPLVTVKESALSKNIDLMRRYCETHAVKLAPHGKTTMSPQLFKRQLDAGSWGITAATPSQVRMMRSFGVPRILLANVLVDPPAIRWIADEMKEDPALEFLCYVDSLDAIDIMERSLAGSEAQIPILVELGFQGGRTGCRSLTDALAVARRAAGSPCLRLMGLSGFEGLMPGTSVAEVISANMIFLANMRRLLVEMNAEGLLPPETEAVVTAGGSSYFDLVVSELGPHRFDFPVLTILRSGCYVTHDAEMYENTSPLAGRSINSQEHRLEQSIELWATVWSRPEPGLAVVGFGKRDAPYDYRLPIAQRVYSRDNERDVQGLFECTGLNDQHAFLKIPDADPLAVGDHVVFGISHPCGAFDKWRVMCVVDDDYDVIDTISTFF